MTKFLLDENVPPAIGVFLQSMNFDVVHANESGMHGASDDQIMDLARQEERTLITFDKHFADLVLYPPGTHWGVIRIRIHPPLLSDVRQALDHFLKQYDLSTIQGTLIVLAKDGFRIRRASLT
jgi:predicted nuclease of predicted toxin-antitoxin system